MCGIAGIFHYDSSHPVAQDRVQRMCDALVHRGPDDSGTHVDGPVGIGIRRLSIIDLSGGHQPIFNEDASLAIVYNGEVYNYKELRRYCEDRGHRFTTQTDTEVVLHLYEEDGPEAVQKLNGMFAFAIWDRRKRELFLARDRFGIKPLYYYTSSEGFWFASEIKSVLVGSDAPRRLSLSALDQYLTFLWVPEPRTILEDIQKLPAAHWMTVGPQSIRLHRYWELELHGEQSMTPDEAASAVGEALRSAVVRQTVADVPVGAFLSGGLDSSAVVASMTLGGRKPHTVHAIGSTPEERRYEGFPDDLPYARSVARRFDLDFHEMVLEPQVAELLPRLIYHLDEPMADPAIIPAYLICQSASSYTKVLLSGMGADEIFGGYRRHVADRFASLYAAVPKVVREGLLSPVLDRLPSAGNGPLVPSIRRLKRIARAASLPEAQRLVDYASWTDTEQRHGLYTTGLENILNGAHAGAVQEAMLEKVSGADRLTQMLYLDATLYLTSHNLNYTDKMSMAASVEVRVPFLDNEVVDLAASLPSNLKVRGGTTKYVLRRAMNGVLPQEVLKRGKTGFGAPIRAWLAGDLKPMVGDLLSDEQLNRRGLFEPTAVKALVEDNLQGRADNSYAIWALLTLELWMQAYKVNGIA